MFPKKPFLFTHIPASCHGFYPKIIKILNGFKKKIVKIASKKFFIYTSTM